MRRAVIAGVVAMVSAAGVARADEADDLVQEATRQAPSCAQTSGDAARDELCQWFLRDLDELRAAVAEAHACASCLVSNQRLSIAEHWVTYDLRKLGHPAAETPVYAVAQATTTATVAATTTTTATATTGVAAAAVVEPAVVERVETVTQVDVRSWCEVGDEAACATAASELSPEELTAWRTRACTKRGVADACFALAADAPRFAARGVRLLERACTKRRDAAACHELATIYASGAHGVAAAPRKAKTYESRCRTLAAAATR